MENKRTTIYDLAQALDVSVATVYRALHDKGRISETTKQRVLDKAAELDFHLNPSAQALRRNAITIGVLICCPIEPFGTEVLRGVRAAFDELAAFNVHPDIRVTEPVNADLCADTVRRALQRFRKQRCTAVLAFLSGPTEPFAEQFEKLYQQGIPVATLVNEIPLSRRCLHVNADGFCAGQMAAQLLRLCCANKRVAILTGSDSTPIHHENLSGFMSEADNVPFAAVDIFEHRDDPDRVVQQLEAILSAEQPYDGVYITSASVVAAFDRLMAVPREDLPHIVTTDLFEQNKQLLAEGRAVATIFQDPFRQGKQAVERLYRHLCGEAYPTTAITPQVILAANMPFYGSDTL